MIAMIISAVVAAVQGIGGPSERMADIECVYEYRTSDDKGREDVYSTILQVGKRSAKFVDYSTFQLDSARTSGASEDQVEAFRLREEKKAQYFDFAIFQNEPAGNMTQATMRLIFRHSMAVAISVQAEHTRWYAGAAGHR